MTWCADAPHQCSKISASSSAFACSMLNQQVELLGLEPRTPTMPTNGMAQLKKHKGHAPTAPADPMLHSTSPRHTHEHMLYSNAVLPPTATCRCYEGRACFWRSDDMAMVSQTKGTMCLASNCTYSRPPDCMVTAGPRLPWKHDPQCHSEGSSLCRIHTTKATLQHGSQSEGCCSLIQAADNLFLQVLPRKSNSHTDLFKSDSYTHS